MQSTFLAWSDMPMGPNWRQLLGLSEFNGEVKVTEDRHKDFQQFLSRYVASESFVNEQSAFVDLLEELVVMKYPVVAQDFIRHYPDLFAPQDFRCMLSAGIAALMTGELGAAETFLREAQILVPEEPAPYVNLCQLFWQDQRLQDGLIWARAGLDSDKNHLRLWELLAVFLKQLDTTSYVEQILEEAKKRSSWAGLSLAADLTSDRDPYLKVEWLKELYEKGDRGEGFLIEYTAAMGTAGMYDELIDVIVEEDLKTDQALAWQLVLHRLQAHLALEDLKAAEVQLSMLERYSDLPESVKPMLVALKNEIEESKEEQLQRNKQ